MFKGTKLTPIINELQQWENQLTSIELFFQDDETVFSDKDKAYIAEKFERIKDAIPELDEALFAKAEGWNKNRMGKVELTIFRLAIYEILKDDTVPAGVAINEAVELAKKYGADASAGFINGVLAKLVEA